MKKQIILIVIILLQCNFTNISAQWEQCNGPYGCNTSCFVVSDSGDILLGTRDAGVYYSSDGGETWHERSVGLDDLHIMEMSMNTSGVFVGNRDGVYFSNNNGEEWITKTVDLEPSWIHSLSCSDSLIIAATYENIYVSEDNGDTWENRNNGISPLYGMVSTVFENEIYIATYRGGFYSSNKGNTWNKMDSTFTKRTIIDFEATKDTLWFTDGRNVYSSTDKGQTFDIIYNTSKIYDLTVSKNFIIVLSDFTIMISYDRGKTWKETLINNKNIYIDILGIYDSTLYSGSSRGFYKSTDMGKNWLEKNNGIPNLPIYNIVELNKVLYASSLDRIYVSHDNGDNWLERKIDSTSDFFQIGAIKVLDSTFYLTSSKGILKSDDFGENWEEVWNEDFISILLMKQCFIGCSYDEGISVSLNTGKTWENVQDYISFLDLFLIDSLVFAVSHYDGIFSSNDYGTSWYSFGSGLASKGSRCIYRFNGYYFAGTKSYGVFRLDEATDNWIEKDIGLQYHTIKDFIGINDVLFVADTLEGVHISYDNGETWKNKNDSIKIPGSICFHANDEYLFVGTSSNSIYRAKISEITNVTEQIPTSTTTLSCKPNPITDKATITFELETTEYITLKITDLLGNTVAELITNELLTTGKHEIEFDNSDLTPGIYLCNLKYGDKTESVKLIKK